MPYANLGWGSPTKSDTGLGWVDYLLDAFQTMPPTPFGMISSRLPIVRKVGDTALNYRSLLDAAGQFNSQIGKVAGPKGQVMNLLQEDELLRMNPYTWDITGPANAFGWGGRIPPQGMGGVNSRPSYSETGKFMDMLIRSLLPNME